MKKLLTAALSFIICSQAYAQPKGTFFHNLYVSKDTAALFINLPNALDVHIPHVKARDIKLKCADTNIKIYPSMAHGDTMAFVIYAKAVKATEMIDLVVAGKVYKVRFTVCPPPALILRLGNIIYSVATTKEMTAQDKLRVCFADPVWGKEYPSDIIEFVFVTNNNGNIMNIQGMGSALTDGMKEMIRSMPPNAMVSFEQVVRTYPPYDIGVAPESLKIMVRE